MSSPSSKSRGLAHATAEGFTLVELVVSIAIMMLIAAVVISSQRTSSDQAQLRNAAQYFSLDLREAQVFGLSVREFSPNGVSSFTIPYGLHFQVSGQNDQGKTYIQYADWNPKDGMYSSGICNPGPTSECINRVAWPANIGVGPICIIPLSGANVCSSGATGPYFVDVTFTRPSPVPSFVIFDRTGGPVSTAGIKGLSVMLTMPSGISKTVTIYTTGQISVQ